MHDLTHDIAALCAAIDDGDDSVLPILADALEEAGDPRAAFLPRELPAALFSNRIPSAPNGPSWWGWQTSTSPTRSEISGEVFDRLPPTSEFGEAGVSRWNLYPTRSAAYLALATAHLEQRAADLDRVRGRQAAKRSR